MHIIKYRWCIDPSVFLSNIIFQYKQNSLSWVYPNPPINFLNHIDIREQFTRHKPQTTKKLFFIQKAAKSNCFMVMIKLVKMLFGIMNINWLCVFFRSCINPKNFMCSHNFAKNATITKIDSKIFIEEN